jgi:uncharacterized protein (DUF1800 family)
MTAVLTPDPISDPDTEIDPGIEPAWESRATNSQPSPATLSLRLAALTLPLAACISPASIPTTIATAPAAPDGSAPPDPAAPQFPAPVTPVPAAIPPTAAEAARFLTQATFGPTDSAITALQRSSYAGWITAQQLLGPAGTHHAYIDLRTAQIIAGNPTATVSTDQFMESFWRQAATGTDELRQRVAFALSEIFVISFLDANVGNYVRGAADYYDMLTANAFGNYRTLLGQITRHPQMGLYLSTLGNQKEDTATGRLPDENYAREVMQLFAIGLVMLDPDGTPQLDGNGNPIATYTHDDIMGLAKVFTGMSWYSPTPTSTTFYGGNADPNRDWQPMSLYDEFHSTSAKTFLGTTIAASGAANTAADIGAALDAIAAHPNVGPFLATRLIQRLVTSNPSKAYVARVAAAFADDGTGTRGNLGAVVAAILLDTEARDMNEVGTPAFGKLREPVVRLANWMRAFSATSQTQSDNGPGGAGFLMYTLDDPATSLGQTPLRAPSVFSYYLPGYIPPNSDLGRVDLLAPEFQTVNEVQVAGYLNFLMNALANGIGHAAVSTGKPDINADYAAASALAGDVGSLVQWVNRLLLYGQMSAVLASVVTGVVSAVALPAGTGVTAAQIAAAQRNRVLLAIYLVMAAPEYLAQR